MNFKTKIFFVNIVSILIAFFLWFMLQKAEFEDKINEEKSKKHYVKIEELKTKIKFESMWENVFIIIWDEIIQKGEIKKK